MQRYSKRKGALSPLDLYDEAELDLEAPNNSNLSFLKDYELTTRRSHIGANYFALKIAAKISQFLQSNPVHELNNDSVYHLTTRCLDSFSQADKDSLDCILVKTLYLYSRDEGFPVNEDWYNTLPRRESLWAKTILNTPLTKIELEVESQRAILDSLENYLERFTDISLGYR